MGLKIYNGDAMCNISFARKDMGADAYLYCPGPSLAEVDDGDIHAPGAVTFALNTAYPHVKPDYWLGMDFPDCYDTGLWGESFRKICRAGRENEIVGDIPIKQYPEVYAATTKRDVNMEYMFENVTGHVPFAWFNHTFGVALHLMLWMGAKRIHLVGCDMGGPKDYYDDRVLSPEDHDINRSLYGKIGNGFMSAFVRVGKKHGVEVISCTPGSPLNDKMPYLPLKDALAKSMAKAPQRGSRVKNCREVAKEKLLNEWCDVRAPRGIVTACDKAYEWLLPWWLENVRKWSALPVAVVDIGLSPQMQTWVLERGYLLHFDGPPLQPTDHKSFGLLHGWKPFAAIKSPFEETLFLDADCEVVGEVDGAFDALSGCDFAIAADQMFHHLKDAEKMDTDETMCNSGVWVCRRGSEIVTEWAKSCMAGVDDWRNNDQPILSKVLHNNAHLAAELPPEFNVLAPVKGNWQALVDGVTSQPKVLHRLTSHPASKAALRERAEEMFEVDGVWLQNAAIMQKCEWRNPPIGDKGVVIGVDAAQEWMLPWWLARYSQHNEYPVMVADFGLTDAGREWCLAHKLILSQPIELDGHGWFKKPLGCLHSVWRRTVWFDTDVEVKRDIGPLFDYTGLAVTVDRGTPQKWKDALPHDATVYNTGCISYEWGDRVLLKWAMTTMLMYKLEAAEGRLLIPTGDQECFAMSVRKYAKWAIQEIPPEQFALRMTDKPDAAIAVHWTGPVGKDVIRGQMGCMQPSNRLAMLDILPKGGVVAEIGVKNGDFSREILAHCRPTELHLIDPWKHFDEGYSDINNVPQDTQDKRYANVRMVLKDDKAVRFHRLTSAAASDRFENDTFDWIYVDGNHDYEYVKRDLELYAPKIKAGGFICGHDYCTLDEAQGVMRAVDEFRDSHGWELVMCTAEQWPSFVLKRKGE